MNFTKSPKTTLILLLITIFLITFTNATRTDPKDSKPKGPAQNRKPKPRIPRSYFGPGSPGWIPGIGQGLGYPGRGPDVAPDGYGYGYGSGSPSGGHSKSGTIRPTVVCKDKGPCYMKKLRCPAKCFTSFSKSGKGYGSGGGGGGCTMDCTKSCTAYC